MDYEVIDGKEYRYVTLRGRTKLIARDGTALNPIRRRQLCTYHLNHDGYPCFGGGVPVHLYVAHGWIDGYFDGAEVNHKDFNRTNFNADNLEWVSHSDNLKYSLEHNYQNVCKGKQGTNNGRAIFTEDDVRNIRKMYYDGYDIVDIVKYYYPNMTTAKEYRSVHSNISGIARGKTWKHIT